MLTPNERQEILTQLHTIAMGDLVQLWRSASGSDLDSQAFRALIEEAYPDIAAQYGSAAADLSAEWYTESAPELSYVPDTADLPPVEQLTSSAQWALGATGTDALDRLAGSLQRSIWNMSRDTILLNVDRERGARWARHASANACAFCRMLASRGAVYSSEAAAGTVTGRGQDMSLAERRARASGETRISGRFIAGGVRTRREDGRKLGSKYHDHCVVPGTMVSGPSSKVGYRRYYEGELITLVTAAGNELSITPQHPVLTDRGWIPAQLLDVGDQLVSARRVDRNVIGGPDVDHVPSAIEDVVSALGVVSSSARLRVPGTSEQFHGDGFASEVDIVVADNLFGYEFDSTVCQPLAQLLLHRASFPGSFSGAFRSRVGELGVLGGRAATSSGGCVCGGSQVGAFCFGQLRHAEAVGRAASSAFYAEIVKPSIHRGAGHAVVLGQCEHTRSIGVTTGKIAGNRKFVDGAVVPRKFDPSLSYCDAEGPSVYAELGCDLVERLAGSVQLDRLVDKRVGEYHGDVLNLETEEGWYSANGITVSNCHCVAIEVRPGQDYEPAPYVEQWEQQYIDATKATNVQGEATDLSAVLAHMRQAGNTR